MMLTITLYKPIKRSKNMNKIVTLICKVNNRIHIYYDRLIVMGKNFRILKV